MKKRTDILYLSNPDERVEHRKLSRLAHFIRFGIQILFILFPNSRKHTNDSGFYWRRVQDSATRLNILYFAYAQTICKARSPASLRSGIRILFLVSFKCELSLQSFCDSYWRRVQDSVTHKILLNFCSTPPRRRRACGIRVLC